MAFLTVIGGLTLVTVAFMWLSVRLILSDGVEPAWVGELGKVYKMFLALLSAYLFWPGVAHWASTAVQTVAGVF